MDENKAYFNHYGIKLELREKNNRLVYCGLTKLVESTPEPNGILKDAISQLDEYFKGQRRVFTIPLELEGTEFQKLVWFQTEKIPFGETLSYGDIAQRINKEKSSRAVGNSLGKNHIIIFIPCHRVISSTGSLGGFTGGLDVKRMLHSLENIRTT